jgi:diguanylate cyclase (GGDEF)-like protein
LSAAKLPTASSHHALYPESPINRWGGFVPILLFNLLVLGLLLCHGVPKHTRVVVDNLSQCLGPLAAFLWSLHGRRIKAVRGKRLACWAPTFLGLGVFGYVVGQCIWTYYELVLHRATPFPSWADAGYLIAYPFLFLGVLGLPTRPLPLAARLRALSDSVLIMIALATFSWYFVLGPTLMQGGETRLARVLGTAYPLSDLILLCCVCILSFRAGGVALRPVVIPLGIGLASIIAIDTVFDFQTLHNTFESGRPVDVAWTLGYMLVAVAAHAARRVAVAPEQITPVVPAKPVEIREWFGRLRATAPALMPYTVVPAVTLLLWHTAHTRGDGKLEPGVYAGAVLVVVLLLLRQFLTLLENQQLAQQMSAFNAALEKTVAERTAQVEALQRLTAAVSGTLEAEEVLAAAVWHTQRVLGADGAAVWLCLEAGAELGATTLHQYGLEGSAEALASLRTAPTGSDGLTSFHDETGNHSLLAPLCWREQTLGWVGAIRWGRDFSGGEMEMLQSVGLQVGMALENARQYRTAREAADRDPVTGLLNHRAIHQYLDTALEEAAREGTPMAVIMADLDNFKLFNDTYGHPVGDKVLQRIAQVLAEGCGDAARVARYGGDEFLIALSPGAGTPEALMLAKELRDRFARETFRQPGDERTIPLDLSFGVAAFPTDSANRHDLLDTADVNLYAAKNSDERIVGLSEMQRANRGLRVHNSFRVLDAMVTAVDNKDRYTRRHSEDVTAYALWIAEEIGLSEEEQHSLRIGGLLHDVGKIGVPDDVLRKPGRLTIEEFDTLKQHPTLGALIVAGVPGMRDVLGAVRHHHERWDGGGYPDGLAGEAIPLEARVLAVADAMSAMTTDRPYRKGLGWEVALAEVRRGSGSQFDPTMATAFLRAAESRRSHPKELAEDTLLKAA